MAKKTTTKNPQPQESKPAGETPVKPKPAAKAPGKAAAPAASVPPARSAAPAKSPAPATQPAPPRAPAPAPAKKAAAPKAKASVTPSPTPKPAAKKSEPKKSGYSTEDVALRAYFIAEKRRAHHLPGDEAHDWIEAERQLAKEFGGGKTAKKR